MQNQQRIVYIVEKEMLILTMGDIVISRGVLVYVV